MAAFGFIERPFRVVIGRSTRAALGQKQTLAGDFPKLPSAQLRLKCIIDAQDSAIFEPVKHHFQSACGNHITTGQRQELEMALPAD